MSSVIPTFRTQQGLVLDMEKEHTLKHSANSHTKTAFWVTLASMSATKQKACFQ